MKLKLYANFLRKHKLISVTYDFQKIPLVKSKSRRTTCNVPSSCTMFYTYPFTSKGGLHLPPPYLFFHITDSQIAHWIIPSGFHSNTLNSTFFKGQLFLIFLKKKSSTRPDFFCQQHLHFQLLPLASSNIHLDSNSEQFKQCPFSYLFFMFPSLLTRKPGSHYLLVCLLIQAPNLFPI